MYIHPVYPISFSSKFIVKYYKLGNPFNNFDKILQSSSSNYSSVKVSFNLSINIYYFYDFISLNIIELKD